MKYFLAGLGIILTIILIIVLIVRDDPATTVVEQNKTAQLSDYANKGGSNVRFIQDGPINARENHRTIRITVSSSERKIEALEGYEGRVIKTQVHANDTNAYSTFLDALNLEGFTRENKEIKVDAPQAVCPQGQRYFYEVNDGSDKVVDLWFASCRKGTFLGDSSGVRTLFRAQIPDYSKFASDVSFNLN